MRPSSPFASTAGATAGIFLVALSAAAQTGADVVRACYVPPTGVVYVIGAAEAPEECLDVRHVEFRFPGGAAGQGATVLARAGTGNGGGAPNAGAPVVPSGGVLFFDLETCPAGWSMYAPAEGRGVVGRPPEGTVGGTVGLALSDLEDRAHGHTVSPFDGVSGPAGVHTHGFEGGSFETGAAGGHNHVWARKTGGNTHSGNDWFTYDANGNQFRLIDWGDGMDAFGAGIFPLAVSGFAARTGYTAIAGEHAHTLELAAMESGPALEHQHPLAIPPSETSTATTAQMMPYVQLLACRKD